jgi:metal-responsive CopG/Arc/MetJ family transcriptional regulator
MSDRRFVMIPLKLPRLLLEQIDAFAAEKTEGNRSAAIRLAIRELLGSSGQSPDAYENPRSQTHGARR